jgi:protein arginine kinase activator
MKCDMCGERTAVVFLQLTADASPDRPGIAAVSDVYLCEECAKKRGLATGTDGGERSLGGIFSDIMDVATASDPKGSACPTCGMTARELRKRLCAGCPDCYSHFRPEIVSSLRREGIEISYKGPLPSKPESFVVPKADPDRLRSDLKKALEREDYELAAYYRDRIMALGERP